MSSSPPHEPSDPSRSFLVRLWRRGEDAPWCATVQPIGGEEPHQFASLERLFLFLLGQTALALPRPSAPAPEVDADSSPRPSQKR